MQIAKRKSINIFLALTLLMSLVLPNFALAYTVTGEADNPKLTIHKYEQEPGTAAGEEGTGQAGQTAEGAPLEGVEFTITQTHKYDPETDTWTEVTGATPIKKTTGEDGTVEFTTADGLELGRYTVQETNGPEHVILNTEVFSVDIPMTSKDGTNLNYDVHIYPKNEIVRGEAELIKQDEAGNALPGVVFGLYKADGTKIEELTTNAEGKISVENLEAGEYYFQEISTVEGKALNTTKIHFEVTKEGTTSVVNWTNSDINSGNVVTNYDKPKIDKDVEGTDKYAVDRDKEYEYNLTVTTPGDIDKYKALGVTDTLDPRLEYAGTWTVTGTDKDNVTFKQDGQTLIWEIDPSKLSPGEEITITFTAKIKPDAELEADETGIPNTGSIHFNNGKGSYTKPADLDNPDPYEPYEPTDPDYPDPENPPTPEEPPTTPPVIVIPTEGGLKVIKVEKENHENKLQGAEFKLTTDPEGNNVVDATGTVVTVNGESHEGLLENLVTNENGEIVIEGLTPGTYYLHETKAPTYTDEDGTEKSYRLLTKPIEVEVENNKTKNKDVIVENSKSGWELPTTGGIGTILFTIIGLALMATAFVLYLRRRKEEQVA